jgi:hypothetical protein
MAMALLTHPETLAYLAVIGACCLLWPSTAVSSGRSVRTWLPIVPYVLLGVGFLVLHLALRTQETQQQELFGWSIKDIGNFFGNVALIGNPFGVDSSTETLRVGNRGWAEDFTDLRTLLPVIGVLVMSIYVVAREWRGPSAGMIAVLFFYVSLVPISLSPLLGALPRKLYLAGPGFALMIAVAAGAIWDDLSQRLTPIGVRPGVAAILAGTLFALVLIVFSFRISQMTSDEFMAHETHYYGLSSDDQQQLIGLIRDAFPEMPGGSRLDVRGLPSSYFAPNDGSLEGRLRVALSLYYPNVRFVGSADPAVVPRQPIMPAGATRFLVLLDCKTECRVIGAGQRVPRPVIAPAERP